MISLCGILKISFFNEFPGRFGSPSSESSFFYAGGMMGYGGSDSLPAC
jgi:hypothetical protein